MGFLSNYSICTFLTDEVCFSKKFEFTSSEVSFLFIVLIYESWRIFKGKSKFGAFSRLLDFYETSKDETYAISWDNDY